MTGNYERTTVGGEEISAFIPLPLPPSDPPLSLDGAVAESLRRAEGALERLDLTGEMVLSLDWFLYAFVRKEAVISSQIEGTQATLVDLLNFEAAPGDDVEASPDIEEICNHLDALSFARQQLADPTGLPLSMRLLNETHRRLMRGVRGAEKQPGEVRSSQNWLGGSRPGNAAYVPPPPHALAEVLSAFENYIHTENDLPALVRAGLLHVQFETIHPYLDGNGRIGRLLVTLLLDEWRLLAQPLLYLSLFFKRHREEYYRRLDAVRREGDWEGWLDFFLDGVATIADEAVSSTRRLFQLVSEDRGRVLQSAGASVNVIRLLERLPRHPIVSVAFVMQHLGISKPTSGRAIDTLERVGLLVETTGKKRDRSWVYRNYLDLLRVGTELEDRPL